MSSRMSKRLRAVCIEIMERLMSRPCATVFLTPVDPKHSTNYSQVIKHPVDLGTIYSKLKNNEYPNVTQWDKDMNLIWQNAEKYSGKNSYVSILANELHKQYDKQYQNVKMLRLAKWSRVIFTYRQKYDSLFQSMPPIFGALATMKERIGSKPLRPFSEDELNLFIRMTGYLNNSSDSRRMAQVIEYYQPNIEMNGNSIELDVNDLETPTLHALRDYVTLRLAEMNIIYPK